MSILSIFFFFFNDTATTEIYTLSLHDALPISYCSVMPETRSTAYDSKIEGNVFFTRFDAALNWVRKNSLWPMPMGLACCAIWRGSDALLAAAMRCDDRGRHGYLQNGSCGEADL